MEISSRHQMFVFLLCLALGGICGLLFDLQRHLRKQSFAGNVRTTIEDLFFSVICIVAMIAVGYWVNDGQIRYYQVMGAMSGALLYAAFLSRTAMWLFNAVQRILMCVMIKPILKILSIAIYPFVKILNILKMLLKKVKHCKNHFAVALKKRKKSLKKRMKML